MEHERTKYTACPICQSADISLSRTTNVTGHARWREPLEPFMRWMRCADCDHSFTEGYFTDAALEMLFVNTDDQQIVGVDIELHRSISARMVNHVVDIKGLPSSDLWVDVGFGNGSLLMTAKEFGFDVFGIDLRKKNVEDIEAFGVPAHQGTLHSAISSVEFASKPTVISMADVVEHEPFPLDSLRLAREFIRDDGVLLVSMPNASAPLWDYWNAADLNPYWYEIEHYHNFGRERLYAVLEKSGFRPIRYFNSERYRCCMEILAKAV
ncbi:class I SAM-dependent methyltransferase [Mycobacterium asiaticum]|uniref:class I SAM-dependent methyltransferase n=1 Tax=Mycobacterium asiaticum TaxID=1790 RepID=UPI000A70CEA0|nr:class I SAM-dependent methyltransferase [Mycobacterium asiaticum]